MSKRLHKFNPATGVTCIECGGHEIEAQHGEPLSVGSAKTETGLKPCPFCGAASELEPYGMRGHELYAVRCSGCNIVTGTLMPRDKAATTWNARATADLEAKLREAINLVTDEGHDNLWRIDDLNEEIAADHRQRFADAIISRLRDTGAI